jgi:FdhD protein
MNHPLKVTPIVEWSAGSERRALDEVVAEEPLEIRVNGTPVSVTMRTPGSDVELAAGFLVTEGIISGCDDIAAAGHLRGATRRRNCNVVDVTLRRGKSVDLERLRRHVFAASSCGICGKASIDAVRMRGIRPPSGDLRLDPEMLTRLPAALRSAQALFERTGGLHAAALFDAFGTLLAVHEDVGRHNAVDKIVGQALLAGRLPLSGHILFVSGRGGFEIVQKAAVSGLPVVACVSAPSSLAVQLARETDLTLIGFLRGRRFIVYSGERRLDARPAASIAGTPLAV